MKNRVFLIECSLFSTGRKMEWKSTNKISLVITFFVHDLNQSALFGLIVSLTSKILNVKMEARRKVRWDDIQDQVDPLLPCDQQLHFETCFVRYVDAFLWFFVIHTHSDSTHSFSSVPCEYTSNGSFIWKIKAQEIGGKESYLFGTVHVPYTRVWDSISSRVKTAFVQADSVMFELDLLDPGTISSLAECQLLPDGLKLHEVIPADLFRRLKRHLNYIRIKLPSWMSLDHRRRGLFAEYLFNAMTSNWERKRPIWIVLMINSLTESDIKSRGIPTLDVYLAQEAQRLNKKTGSVERAKDNCMSLNSLSINHSIYALNDTLSQHELIRRLKNQKRKKKRRRNPGSSLLPSQEERSSDLSVKERSKSDESSSKSLLSIMPTDDLARHYNCGNLTFFTNKESDTISALLQSSPFQIPSSEKTDPMPLLPPKTEESLIISSSNQQPITEESLMISSSNQQPISNSSSRNDVATKIDNYIRSELIIGRNKKWTRKMTRLLRSHPNESFFFAFGAGHFLGNNSVVQMLRHVGFDVVRMVDEESVSWGGIDS